MNTRLLLNLGLLALVVVLGLLAYFQPGVKKPPATPKLTDLAVADIDRIRIEDRDGKTIVLARAGEHWQLVEPVQLPANAFRVESLLRLLDEPSQARLDAKNLEMAEFGLDTPRIRLYLNDRGFTFGTTEPLNGRRYIRIGDTVHLVTDQYFHLLIGGYTEFVNQQLVPPDSRIAEIVTPGWHLTRATEGKWTLSPTKPGLSADTLNMLADNWCNAQAIWIQPYEKSEAKGQVVVRLEGTEHPLKFDILAREPEFILARPEIGLQYHLAEDAARTLLEVKENPPEPGQDGTVQEAPQSPD